MRILAVDTSSERGSICIVKNDVILGEIRLASSVQHAERLFRGIEFLLESVPISLQEIDLFVSARGPGSFTGLRVGLAAMKGFAAADGHPGAGISTLDALAWRAGEEFRIENEWISPVIDARRGEVYGALYRRLDGKLIQERAPAAMKPERWFDSLPNSAIHFCGDGALRYRTLLDRPGWQFCDMDLYLASTMAKLAATDWKGPLEPLYVRKPEAETALEARNDRIAGPGPKG